MIEDLPRDMGRLAESVAHPVWGAGLGLGKLSEPECFQQTLPGLAPRRSRLADAINSWVDERDR